MEIEITSKYRDVSKYFEALKWQRLQFCIQYQDKTLKTRSCQRETAFISR